MPNISHHSDAIPFHAGVPFGTQKWLYISYPVACGLNTAQGLDSKRVATFATFCGAPLQVFEIAMLFKPLEARLRTCGARVGERLAISTDYPLRRAWPDRAETVLRQADGALINGRETSLW